MAAPPILFRQFFTATGAPAANCRLYTYATGTTTPQATYSDAALTVANANPIVLDAAGRCDLYLSPQPVAYRFRLETPLAALIDEQDDVVGLAPASTGSFVPTEGGTMTGLLVLSGNATENLNPTPMQQVNSLIAAAVATVASSAANAVPVGTIAMWLTGAPPANWLHLNGAAVSRTTYSALFTLFGTAFGSGDGSTTFKLPDVRGEFPRFWDAARGVDSGRAIATAQAQALQAHTHATTFDLVSTPGGAFNRCAELNALQNFTSTSSSTGGAETRPRNFAFMAIVKAM